MRGNRNDQPMMLAWIDIEARVPLDHPLRPIKKLADDALRALSETFDRMYAQNGRRSIPPERLLKASLLIPLYSIRSERQLCEQLEYNLLFRWFSGHGPVGTGLRPDHLLQEPPAAAAPSGGPGAVR